MTDGDGRTVLMVGLSYGNLDKFRAMPMDTFIKIEGEAMGLPIDVMIFSGRTEEEMGRYFAERIGPETQVHIDPKLRS